MADQGEPARVLLISRLYPSDDALYKYPFVHRRVLEYRSRGMLVDVVRPKLNRPSSTHEFEGVSCRTLSRGDLAAVLRTGGHRVIAVHGLDEEIWEVLAPHVGNRRVVVWLHGTELLGFSHVEHTYTDASEREAARSQFAKRLGFWRTLISDKAYDVRLVFVSDFAASRAMADLGAGLDPERWTVIPNPIDTQLFSYSRKNPDQSRRLLSIRPFKATTYGCDMIVDTVVKLSSRSIFDNLRFTIIGDGPLFDEISAPVRPFANVELSKGFIRQAEIAKAHSAHGLFLVPTRMDTQGVSRDEAMSSGLVPLTNRVDAIPEFVDDTCGVIAPPEDSGALAEGVERLVRDPEMFGRMSEAAARRVRDRIGVERIIPQEIAYLSGDRS